MIGAPFQEASIPFHWLLKPNDLTPRELGILVLNPSMGNQQIINTLRSGNTPIQVVFNNQQTIEHLAGRVAEQLEMDSLSLINEMQK